MVVFIFSDLDCKYAFGANLVQETKIVSLSSNLVPRLIWICRIQWCCSLFLFLTGNSFLGANFIIESEVWYLRNFRYAEFVSCSLFPILSQFKLKFGTLTNSNIQSLMVFFTFFVFLVKMLFMGKFDLKKSKLSV